MSRLKKYANAYNLDTKGALEKDEFIDALIAGIKITGNVIERCSHWLLWGFLINRKGETGSRYVSFLELSTTTVPS